MTTTLVEHRAKNTLHCPARGLRTLFVQYDAQVGGSPISGSMVVKALVDADWQVDAVFGSNGPMTQRYEQLGCRIHVLAQGQFLLDIFRRRMPAHGGPAAAGFHDQRVVHVQGGHGRAAGRRPTDDLRSVRTPMEVIFPRVPSRVEQGRRFARPNPGKAHFGSGIIHQTGELTEDEADELERLAQVERVMQRVKARARLHAVV